MVTCLCFTFRPSSNLKVEMPSQVSIHVILLLAYAQLLSRMTKSLKYLAGLECSSQDESARHLESARIKLSSNVESIRGIHKLLRTKSLQEAHLPYCNAALMVCACYVECIKYLLGKVMLNPNVDYALVKSEFNLGSMEPATSTDEWRSSTEKIHALFQVIRISLLSKSKPDQKDCQYFHQILVAIQTCIQLFPDTIHYDSDSETEVEYKHHTPSRCGQVSERERERENIYAPLIFFLYFLYHVTWCHAVMLCLQDGCGITGPCSWMGERRTDCKRIMEDRATLNCLIYALENWDVFNTMPGIITPTHQEAATRHAQKRPRDKENIPPEKRPCAQAMYEDFNLSMSNTFIIR